MAHYFIDTDAHGDTHLWRAEDEEDPRPTVVLSQRGLDPQVWDAARALVNAAVVCFRWETCWPHALLDPWAVLTTTDRQAVTCAACAHALGNQKQEPPRAT